MLKKLFNGLIVATAIVAISGCGENESSVQENSKSIIGDWTTDCHKDENYYVIKRTIFNEDGSGSCTKMYYLDDKCTIFSHQGGFGDITYKIGNDTIGSDNEPAKEIDFYIINGGYTYYTMYRINNEDILSIVNNPNDGKTPETRSSDFNYAVILTK